MTREELSATMKSYQSRRQKLGISSDVFGGALGVSGSTIRAWENMTQEPKTIYVMGIGALLDDLEAGRKTLPTSRQVMNDRTKAQALSLRDAAVLSGVIRRVLEIPREVGRKAIGATEQDFMMKEGGLMAITMKELAKLLFRYAEEIQAGDSGDRGVQLSFAGQLDTSGQ